MLKYLFLFATVCFTGIYLQAQPVKKAEVLYKNGLKLKDQGKFNEAIAAFKKAITLNKLYDSAYLQLSLVYAGISKTDSAVITLKNALKAKPSFANGYVALGNVYRDYKNNTDEALINYLKALKLDSTNKLNYYNIAWSYNAKTNYREAIKYAVKALEIDNNYKPAYNELGHAYNQLKAYAECIEQLKKNLAVSVNELPLLYSAYCYMELNQKDNALKMYEELNKINPKMAENLKKKIDAKQFEVKQ